MTTLLDVATSLTAVNRPAALQYIQSQGDRLWLLVPFLEHVTAPCGTAPLAPAIEGAPDDTPFFAMTVYRPRSLYAYIDALLARAPAHMPGVAADIFARLRACNRLMWACAKLPSALAVMAFWWIATAHHGVFDMVLATEPADSWWRDETRFERLRDTVDAHIWRIAKSDISVVIARARRFQALMAYVYIHRVDTLLLYAQRPNDVRISRDEKQAICQQHSPQETPRQCPPTPQSQSRLVRPRRDQS